jgi:hypothetical protein
MRLRVWGAVLAATVISAQPAASQAPPVTPTSGVLSGARVKTGTSTFRISGQVGAQTMDIGTLTQTITAITVGGRQMLQTVQSITGPMGAGTDTSVVDAKTLAPVTLRGYNNGGTLVVDFLGSKVRGEKKDAEGSAQAIDQTLSHVVYDSSVMDLLMQGLIAKDGLAVRLPVYIYEQGGLVWYDVKVAGEKKTAAGAAWDIVVTTPEAEMHYLIDKATSASLGYEATNANGMKLMMTRSGS